MSKEKKKIEALSKIEGVSKKDPLGWVDLARSELPHGGKYYPATWRFQVKPADIKVLKHISAVNENDTMAVIEAFHFVIENNIRITEKGERNIRQIPSTMIHDIERLEFVLLVQQYSAVKKQVTFNHKCKHCDHNNEIILSKEILEYKEVFPAMDKFNNGSLVWDIVPKEQKDQPIIKPFQFSFTTVQDFRKITDFQQRMNEKGDKYDPNFGLIYPILKHKTNSNKIDDVYQIFLNIGDSVEYQFYHDVCVKYMDKSLTGIVEGTCSNCAKQFQTTLRPSNKPSDYFIVVDSSSYFD